MNEKFVIPIGRFTNEIPEYWLNFLFNLDLSINDWRKESNCGLKQYNAVYVEDPERLIFDSEQDYVYFLLRWS